MAHGDLGELGAVAEQPAHVLHRGRVQRGLVEPCREEAHGRVREVVGGRDGAENCAGHGLVGKRQARRGRAGNRRAAAGAGRIRGRRRRRYRRRRRRRAKLVDGLLPEHDAAALLERGEDLVDEGVEVRARALRRDVLKVVVGRVLQ